MALLYCALFLSAFAFLLKRLRFDAAETSILLAANCVFLYWLLHTDVHYFEMDITGHLKYIAYIASHDSIPSPNAGWIFYHPPLYYILMAALQSVAEHMLHFHGVEYLRCTSLILFNAFLMIGIRTLRLELTERSYYLMAAWLMAFWPTGFIFASAIDSHLLLYPFVAASFYFLLRWHDALNPRHLAACLLFAAAAIATRSNGYLLLPTIGIVALWHLHKRSISLQILRYPPIILACVVIMLGIAENSGRIMYYRITSNSQQSLVVGNETSILALERVRVPNVPAAFLPTDYRAYVAEPFVNHNHASDSYEMWNDLLKSASFGQWKFHSGGIGALLNMAMLLLWMIALLPTLFYPRDLLIKRLPHLALIAFSLVASVYVRYTVPAYCSTNFRFIYFLTIPLTMLFASNLQMLLRQRFTTLSFIGVLTAVAFPLLAVLAYIEQV